MGDKRCMPTYPPSALTMFWSERDCNVNKHGSIISVTVCMHLLPSHPSKQWMPVGKVLYPKTRGKTISTVLQDYICDLISIKTYKIAKSI